MFPSTGHRAIASFLLKTMEEDSLSLGYENWRTGEFAFFRKMIHVQKTSSARQLPRQTEAGLLFRENILPLVIGELYSPTHEDCQLLRTASLSLAHTDTYVPQIHSLF